MIFISIVITLVLDRVFTQFHRFRRFNGLQTYFDWMEDVLSISRLPAWVSIVVLVLPMLLVLSFVEGIFSTGLFGLFALAFNVVVLFLCLGPLDGDRQVDDYLHAIDTGDPQNRLDAASALYEKPADMNFSQQVSQVVDAIFTSAHRRIFACLFWFVLLGPIGAIFYRIVEQSTHLSFNDARAQKLSSAFAVLLGYLEWVSVRLTLLAFMLGGHYEGALSGYKKATKELMDVNETNQGILSYSGRGAIQYLPIETDPQASEQVKKARGLILRSLVVWLVFSLLLSWV